MTGSISAEHDYYGNVREDVGHLVPADARTVLDVGCGRGMLGAYLKTLNSSRLVFGVEISEAAGATARSRLDGVVVGDLLTVPLPYATSSMDCIVFADVLEHLADPEAALRRMRPYLKPGGTVICSIPNMRHYTVILQLLRRGWEYADYGLFDRTHLRFFSLRSMESLLVQSGFTVVRRLPHVVASRKMRMLNSLAGGRFTDFLAMQYLLVAQIVPGPP